MYVQINYFQTVNEALTAVSTNAFGFEIIAAENVTKKSDLEERAAEMCKRLPFCMVDFVFTPESELVGGDLYADRFDILYEVWATMMNYGIRIDQFLITANTRMDGRYDYHILASLVDGAGYTAFNPLKISDQLVDVLNDLREREIVDDMPITIQADQVVYKTRAYSLPLADIKAADRNPLCHELVQPYRDYILRQLKEKLFG